MKMDENYQQLIQQGLIELCCLVVERHNAEQAFDRAQWNVSYYRKPKVKASKVWSDPIKLSKKLEQVQLKALQKQKQLVEIQKCLNEPITKARWDIFASFRYENGRVSSIWLPDTENVCGITLEMDKIIKMVDQYEANTILTKALEDDNLL